MPKLVYLSCANADVLFASELRKHLQGLERQGVLRIWGREDLLPGEPWAHRSDEMLRAAHVFVALVSADYLAECIDELHSALRLSERGLQIAPVIVRACLWERSALSGSALVGGGASPVANADHRDSAWDRVVRALCVLIGEPVPNASDRPPAPRGRMRSDPALTEPDPSAHVGPALEDAFVRRRRLLDASANTEEIDREIRELKRQLRDGGQLRPGDSLSGDRYHLLRRIGRGGFATVWEALDKARGERVAIKVLHPDLRSESTLARFERGARIMSELEHPHVVRVLEPATEDVGFVYFVMEYLPGGDLRAAVLNSKIAPKEVVSLVCRIGEALIEAHRRELVHRDVKPSNILLDNEGKPKLTDFDLVAARDSTGGTGSGGLGTYLYAAPEVMSDARNATVRADVYGLGMTAVFCFHGKDLPGEFLERKSDVLDGLDIPLRLRDVLRKSISTDPDARFATMKKFVRALASAGQQRGILQPDVAFTVLRPLAGLLVAAGIVAALWQPSPPPSPKLPSVIGCPVWRATGIAEPSGWLGAAAASLACERARVLLGGRPERTLGPPELQVLPRGPTDNFPEDPYAQWDARERSLEAARRRADAYLDGEVATNGAGFQVRLTYHDPDGGEIAGAAGNGHALYTAVRQAMDSMIAAGKFPKVGSLDPAIGEWARTSDVDTALSQLDLSISLTQNAGDLHDECARIDQRRNCPADAIQLEKWICAYTFGEPLPAVEAAATSSSSAAEVAARARTEHIVQKLDSKELVLRMDDLLSQKPPAWGHAVLASTLSCALQSENMKRARDLAGEAVRAEPRNPDGLFCRPWGQLISVTSSTDSARASASAMQAWVPWDSRGWLAGVSTAADPAVALSHARRAYLLTPLDTQVAEKLASLLLAAGEREEVRGIVESLRQAGYPVHHMESEILSFRIQVSEASFDLALAHAERTMTIGPGDVGWVRVQKLDMASRALEVAEILGQGPRIADLAVERFIVPEPSPLEGAFRSVPVQAIAICALASSRVSRRCFDRLRELRPRLSGGNLLKTDTFLEGAEKYARADWQGAAWAWRQVADDSLFAPALTTAMAETLERDGATELVELVEARLLKREKEFHGATLAHVRGARRAAAQGKTDEARGLADKVIAAWGASSANVPFVEEMRALKRRLK